MPNRIPIGSTVFVQAAAWMMSAAWIRKQIQDTSTAPPMSISGIAYAMRHTVASQIGMAFELALKSLAQGLSANPDGQPQVLQSHRLIEDLWDDIPDALQTRIDANVDSAVQGTFGDEYAGKALAFGSYLRKHRQFLDATVANRYALPGQHVWKSDHRFMRPWFPIASETYQGKPCVDGIGVLMAYWWAIMRQARRMRWEEARCAEDPALKADRDEAWALVDRATAQMFGRFAVLTRDQLRERREANRKRQSKRQKS